MRAPRKKGGRLNSLPTSQTVCDHEIAIPAILEVEPERHLNNARVAAEDSVRMVEVRPPDSV